MNKWLGEESLGTGNKKSLFIDECMKRHKRAIARMVHKEDREAIQYVEKRAKELSLAIANFQCQKCSKKENLTYHHLIMRRAKEYMDFFRYASQRYYWGNIIILCVPCHMKYHEVVDKSDEDYMTIPNEEIERVKEKFFEVKE